MDLVMVLYNNNSGVGIGDEDYFRPKVQISPKPASKPLELNVQEGPRYNKVAPLVERIGTGYCVKLIHRDQRVKTCNVFHYDSSPPETVHVAVVPHNKFDLPITEKYSLTLAYQRNNQGIWATKSREASRFNLTTTFKPGSDYHSAFEALFEKAKR